MVASVHGIVARAARRSDELILFTDRVRVAGNVIDLKATGYWVGGHQAFYRRVAAGDLIQARH